jgi:predicted metal-dependent hydrolase
MSPQAARAIPVRNVKLGADHPDRPFCGGDVAFNALFVALSGIFPDGERFFVRSVKHFQDQVDDPELRAAIASFAAQESLHGREHERLNAFFASRAIDVEVAARHIRRVLALLERFPPRQRLAMTAFMEHVTTHLAERWLTYRPFLETSDPKAIELWCWHAIEELEHKAVAFDLFTAVGGTMNDRRVAVATVMAVVILPLVPLWIALIAGDGQLRHARRYARSMRAALAKEGFLGPVLACAPLFLRPDFHPNRRDTSALLDTWRERLFGAKGSLREALRGRGVARAA